ncbi:hypothetical protein HPP92_019720 [Vanilla planifolia]|uniref:Uncharacterized protein n=1 Tax=Vanilla planifolia TaxID=51239 RepID=A0A835Q3T9_VANPL|nr:hypothetical protein HPP92_019720 [Vanilla planifolia]
MDPGADPVESLLRAVRDAVSPLEFSILRVTKDLQSHWMDSRKEAKENSLFGGSYCLAKKKVLQEKAAISAAGDVRKMGLLSEKTPTKALFRAFSRKPSGEDRGALAAEAVSDESCSNCFRFTVLWSLLFSNVVKVFPNSLRCVKRCFIKPCSQEDDELLSSPFCFEIKGKEPCSGASFDKGSALQEAESLPSELLLFFGFDSLRQWSKSSNSSVNRASWVIDRIKEIPSVVKERQEGVNVFLSNVGFAKVGGALEHLVGFAPSLNDENKEHEANTHIKEEGADKDEPDSNPSQKLGSNLLNIPLSNVERLCSTFPTVCLTELIEFLPLLGKSSSEHPDKKKLYSVQDFFRYTQAEGLPDNESNAAAMMRYLNSDTDESISYGHFRNFMLLLPSDRLEEDPRNVWFEAATLVAVPPPVEIYTESVLKSALAGGLASALSTSIMYPIDTMKTRVQASALSSPKLTSKLSQIGIRGLYRGSIPAVLGQFSSHGLRTGIFEASKLILINVAPTLPDIQVQSTASFCSTFLGTAVRIPCEVLKQRLQAGLFDNVGEAIVGTLQQDGLRGFFRGTGATLCREVPFYVAGMSLYAEAKKAAQTLLKRELEPWETVAVGALSGGLAAVVTNPFDVMKTRMMTAPQGQPVSMQMVALSVLQQEGPLGFFKGALPRFFWIAPLGAMNFAGYEIAKKAMVEADRVDGEPFQEKKMAKAT